MARLFISYSRRDADIAYNLVSQLRMYGYDVWVDDERIKLGEDWTRSIQKAIEEADYILVLLSPNALQSEWIHSEIRGALDLKKSIIPVLIEGNEETSIPLSLREIKYFDARKLDERTIEQLAATVQKPEPVTS
jgi:TIR domain